MSTPVYPVLRPRRCVPGRSVRLCCAVVLACGLSGKILSAAEPDGAGESVARTWQTPDGLPQNTVLAIAQTADHYLWVGTRGGLARFDGVRFSPLGLEDGLRSLDVVALEADGAGGLWIGTFGGGLSHWQDGKVRTFTTADGLAHNNTMILAPDGAGGVWVGGPAGLQRWSRAGTLVSGPPVGLPPGEIISLEARGEKLWIFTHAGGLFFCEDDHCTPVPGPAGVPLENGYALLADAAGDLWISIGSGRILRLHDKTWKEYTETDGVPFSFIYSLEEGAAGEIWAGSHEQGMVVFRDGRFHPVQAGVMAPGIRAVFRSDDGLIWAGTQGGGLTRLTRQRVALWPAGEGPVQGLAEDPPGHFWAMRYGSGGVYEGALSRLTLATDLPGRGENPFFLTALRMKSGALCFGGSSNLLRREPGTADFLRISTRETITALGEGDDGKWWAGTREGTLREVRADGPAPVPGGQFAAGISSIVSDGADGLWLSTRGAGLWHWRDGQARHWGRTEGLPADTLQTLYRDAAGTVWIGTLGGGLAWLDGERVKSVSTAQGLAEDCIHQILEDDAGHLWLGGYRGISRVDRRDLAAVAAGTGQRVHTLTIAGSAGPWVMECTGGYGPAGLRSEDGRLLFSTQRGVIVVDPHDFATDPPPPPARIEELRVGGKPVRLQSPLTIPPGSGDLEIRYTAFCYEDPASLRFRYLLTGAGDTWTEAGNQRTLRLPSLAPGTYSFSVSAADAGGDWGEPGAALTFTVRPFFWQTGWFAAGVVGALMLSGGALVAWRTRARIRQARTREELAHARAEALYHRGEVAHLTRVAMLGELSAALAHELNQPLAAILTNAQTGRRLLTQPAADPAEMVGIFDDIVEADQRASEVIQRLRGLLKKGEFHPEPVEPGPLLREVIRLMHGDLQSRGVQTVMALAAGLPRVRGDRVQLQQVVINLVLNAAEAMMQQPEGTRVLTLRAALLTDREIEVRVEDTGPGITEGDEERIFQPYHTTRPDGLGLGLSLSRSILHAHGGRLGIDRPAAGGAVFTFTLQVWETAAS